MKVVVTGASGKAGRAVVQGLLEREHDALAVDVVSPVAIRKARGLLGYEPQRSWRDHVAT